MDKLLFLALKKTCKCFHHKMYVCIWIPFTEILFDGFYYIVCTKTLNIKNLRLSCIQDKICIVCIYRYEFLQKDYHQDLIV